MDDETISFSASVEPAAAPPPGRSRLAIAMLVTTGLLLVAAVLFGVLGMQAQSEASDERDAAAAATERRHELAAHQQTIHDQRDELETRVLALPDKYQAAADQFVALLDAGDHYGGLLDQAIDLHNSGDVAGATAVLSGDGASTIADMTAKKGVTQETMQAAQDALHQIQEEL